jgi:hypothetical protein
MEGNRALSLSCSRCHRCRNRERAMTETAADYLLAIFLGVGFAALLFFGASS